MVFAKSRIRLDFLCYQYFIINLIFFCCYSGVDILVYAITLTSFIVFGYHMESLCYILRKKRGSCIILALL